MVVIIKKTMLNQAVRFAVMVKIVLRLSAMTKFVSKAGSCRLEQVRPENPLSLWEYFNVGGWDCRLTRRWVRKDKNFSPGHFLSPLLGRKLVSPSGIIGLKADLFDPDQFLAQWLPLLAGCVEISSAHPRP